MKRYGLFAAAVLSAGYLTFVLFQQGSNTSHSPRVAQPQNLADQSQRIEPDEWAVVSDDNVSDANVSDEDIVRISDHQAESADGLITLLRAEGPTPQTPDPNLFERLTSPAGYDFNSNPSSVQRGQQSCNVLRQAIVAYETKLAVIANNLANADTIAFKRSRVIFEPSSYHDQVLPGRQDSTGQFAPTGIAVGLGTRVQCTQTDFSQGAFVQTNRELDVAIEGKGFFQVNDPDTGKLAYSRAGNFSVNALGQLVIGSAQTGRLVIPPITFPQDATGISIAPNGTVQYAQSHSPTLSQAGQLRLASFINPDGLLKLGENLYRQTDASGPAQISDDPASTLFGTPGQNGVGVLRQGALELSNVNVTEESREWSQTVDRLKSLQALLRAE
jgi:flagellar basal-body rod protein FlgG